MNYELIIWQFQIINYSLSLSLSLSFISAPSLTPLKNILSYARVNSGVTLINKGLSEVSFILKSMSVYEDLSFEIRQTLGEKNRPVARELQNVF